MEPNLTSTPHYRSYSSILYTIVVFFIAFAYASVIALQPIDIFVDRNYYLIYAANSTDILEGYLQQGLHIAIFNEPLWLSINIALNLLFEPEDVVRCVIFFPAFVVSYIVLRTNPKYFWLLLAFLLLPQVLKNHVTHLRQGVAIAVFLVACRADKLVVQYILLICACLIHSSFFVLLFLYFLNVGFTQLRLASDLRFIIVIFAGVALGLLGIWLAALVGARQGDQYVDFQVDGSGLGFAFWSVVTIIFVFQGKMFLRQHSFSVSILLIYLSTYFFLPVTARVFESGLLLILLASLSLTSVRKYCFYSMFGAYMFLLWYPRLSLPGLGWGIESYL